MALHLSVKHLQIIKSNNQLAITVAAAVVICVFCLISVKSLLSQSSYQRRIIAAKHTAANQLKSNVTAANQLLVQYKVFEANDPNIIGGIGGDNPGNGPSDGDNARIVLDALPSQYDFPALITSVEKILNADGVNIQAIGGTDEGQPDLSSNGTATISPVPITFSVDGLTNYSNGHRLLLDFERSIRPIDITRLELTGTRDNMHVTFDATTYYQPAKNFVVGQKEIR